MSENRVSKLLNIKYPFVQGSMNWLTSARFVAAVSNAGGLGILGPNAGQSTVTRDAIENAERMRQEIRKTRALTDQPFAVQYIMGVPGLANPFSEGILRVLQEEKVQDIMVLGIGKIYEAEQVKTLKDMGFTILFRGLTPTVESARAVEAAGADIYIATGYDEGGALPENPVGTMVIVPLISDALEIPVLAAGGIVDNRTVKAAMILGAEGVYVGTALLVAEEAPLSMAAKQDILRAHLQDLIVYRSVPTQWRVTPHKLGLKLLELDREGLPGKDINEQMLEGGDIRSGMLLGNLENGIVSVSNSVDYLKEIRPVKAIIEEMMQGVVE